MVIDKACQHTETRVAKSTKLGAWLVAALVTQYNKQAAYYLFSINNSNTYQILILTITMPTITTTTTTITTIAMSTATTFQHVLKVKQACDLCYVRKVKCNGICPYSHYVVAKLQCTYLAVHKKKRPQKKRPQGLLKHTQRIPPAVLIVEVKFIKAVQDKLSANINTLKGFLRDYELKQ